MQAESTSSELQEGLPLRNKYTKNKAKLIAFTPCFSTNLLLRKSTDFGCQ